jgi:hypothetical protein
MRERDYTCRARPVPRRADMENVMANPSRPEDLQQINSDALQSMNRYHEGLINKALRAKNLIPEEGFVEPDIAALAANFFWQLRRNQLSHAIDALLAKPPQKTDSLGLPTGPVSGA